MYKFLILCGPSGSGKTTVRDELLHISKLKRYPLSYFKTIQVTSRPKRLNESYEYFDEKSNYIFMKDSVISEIKKSLVGFNHNSEKFGGIYGTLPMFSDIKINIIILSYEGLKDFFDNCVLPEYEVYIAYLELTESFRDGRDISGEKTRLTEILNELSEKKVAIKEFLGNDEVTAENVNEWLEKEIL